jgi:hypothetical protein
MPRIVSDDDERYQDTTDERGIVRDGKIVRASMFDSIRARGFAPPDVRAGGPFVVDHRPGNWALPDQRRALTDSELIDARRRIADAIAEHDRRDTNAWRNPPNGPQRPVGEFAAGAKIPTGAYPLSAGEGSRCTINGEDGRLVREGNWLVCERTRANDAQALQDVRAGAYRAYDEEMANAWRNPR